MKKFYLLIFTAVMVVFGGAASAQITYNSINPNPANLHWADDGFWVGGVHPPNNCTLCTINVYSNVTLDPADGINLGIVSSTIQIFGNTIVTINTNLEFTASTIIVGSDATGSAAIILNDQVGLDMASSVRLANVNNYINTNNDDANVPNGPYEDIGNPGNFSAGIYQPVTPPVGGYDYTAVLTNYGLGSADPSGFYGSQYNLNCNFGSVTGYPGDCTAGFIYGPAVTGTDPSNTAAGTVFLQSTTLPVELVQFLASKNADGSVKLIWATAQELNASRYEVERSSDKGSWNKIGEVAAKGNSTVTTNYIYTDRTPLSGTSFYRLKMLDLDGKFKYSAVALVSSTADDNPLVIYRNPFLDQIRLKVNVQKAQTLTITVSDVLGKNYIRQTYSASIGDNLINLVPANAATGMYILKIHGSSYDQTVKLAKD